MGCVAATPAAPTSVRLDFARRAEGVAQVRGFGALPQTVSLAHGGLPQP